MNYLIDYKIHFANSNQTIKQIHKSFKVVYNMKVFHY